MIVQPVVEPMDRFAALISTLSLWPGLHAQHRGHRAAAAGRGGGQAAAGRRDQLRGDGGRHRQHRAYDRRGERQRGGGRCTVENLGQTVLVANFGTRQ